MRQFYKIRFISRNSPIGWSPRSCDLTPLKYFLWGYVKSMVYANKPAMSAELRTVSAENRKNWVQRLDFCKRLVVFMQNGSSFVHNGSERTFAGIKNFIDIQNRLCFI